MSKDDSNLLLELLQSEAVFNLDDLDQSPRLPVGLPNHPCMPRDQTSRDDAAPFKHAASVLDVARALQDEALPGPPGPHPGSSPHQRGAGEHAGALGLWRGEMPPAWPEPQPQPHAASWGPGNTGFVPAALPPVATTARSVPSRPPQHFWQPQAALGSALGGAATQAQAEQPWQVRLKPAWDVCSRHACACA